MEEKGYENLSDQANDTLDKTTQAVKSNSDLQKSIIDNMLKETQKSYADAYEQIEEIIKNTGYSVSESFDEIIAKAKLTSEEVKKVSPSVTTSGEGVDNQRTDKNQADQYTKNAANSSSTGTNATKDYSNANPSANDLSESGISGQQNAQLNNNLKNTVNNAKNVVSESMKEYNAKKSALQQWYNGVGGDVDKTKLKEKHHDFYTYFWKKGKNVRQKDFEEVARILGHNYIIKQPSGNEVSTSKVAALRNPVIPYSIVFGCAKYEDGSYERYAKGKIHWCKLWYADLGESTCKNLASWVHETIPMMIAEYKQYFLSNDGSKRANITLIAKNLLSIDQSYGSSTKGWDGSSLKT